MITHDHLKGILDNIGITNAVVIDDKLNEDHQAIKDILEGLYDTTEFDVKSFVENLEYSLQDLKDLERYPLLLVKKLKEKFPDLINSEINELLLILFEIFDPANIELLESVTHELVIESNTVLFLDYRLENSAIKSEQLASLLAQKGTADSNPRCIIFISNDKYFTFGEERYRMIDYKERTEYFRKLRGEHESKYFKHTVYDYINKRNLSTKTRTTDELFKVFQNLYGSKKFFQLLNCVEDILFSSSEEVLGEFHLLNARSIQGMIKDKVLEEGISAPTFLIQWISRHVAKKVEQKEDTGLRMDPILRDINNWTQSYYEIHEDIVLREILLSEMWDKKVNERYLSVDFGDIFEIDYNNEKKRAILLTQTCTLAVRNNGKRTGRVAMLVLENKEKLGRESTISIDDWNGEKITFDLDETISIPISFLDITSLNVDGRAIVQWTPGGNTFTCPSQALWSDGYRLMMKSFIEELSRILMRSNKAMHQIDETYMPFVNHTTPQLHAYEFPIKRLNRLDHQYSLYVFQEAQAWWGRIGLPVNVNFMDDYKENEGTVNSHGSSYIFKFYVKKRLNDFTDIGISIDDLIFIINKHYDDDTSSNEQLRALLNRPEVAHLHYASGKKILSLKSNKTGIEHLSKNKVYIKLISEKPVIVELKIGIISRYILDGDDITTSVIDFDTDIDGNIRLKIKRALIEEKNLEQYIERIDDKTSIKDGIGPIVSLSRKDQIFNYEINKNHLSLESVIIEQESAATIELNISE